MGKQTFTIPEGCSATIEQLGDKIVIAFKPKKVEFKKGDFVTAEYGDGENVIAIVKTIKDSFYFTCFAHFITHRDCLDINTYWETNSHKVIRYSTPQERQLLFDKLESEGWKFNAEKCELERIKWVPEHGEDYKFISSAGIIEYSLNDPTSYDTSRINIGNCFKPNSLNPEKVKKLYAEFIQKVKEAHNINY